MNSEFARRDHLITTRRKNINLELANPSPSVIASAFVFRIRMRHASHIKRQIKRQVIHHIKRQIKRQIKRHFEWCDIWLIDVIDWLKDNMSLL